MLVIKDRNLPFKLEDGAENQRLAQHHTGIVDEVASGEIIGAIDHQIVLRKQRQRITGR